jgi:hypothetical protein
MFNHRLENFVSQIEGGTEAESVREENDEEDIRV